jgi:hypothetical protein
MYKISHFSAEQHGEPTAIPLFTRADTAFEKVASATLLPEVVRYIDTLHPRQDAQYVLDNALGAGEWWSSNSNGDHFEEAGLIHRPDDWTGNPLLDKIKAKEWAYGFPTFYNAKPFGHHRNTDPTRAYGEVELAAWNDKMKRVELVIRVDKDKCFAYGGGVVWDKLTAGQYPDTSMGAKVAYDLCFPAGTLVRTTEGHVPIEQVSVGTQVLTHTGSIRTVRRTFARSARVVTVRTLGMPDVQATDNHPFLALREAQVRTCKGTAGGRRLRHSFHPGQSICRHCGATPNYEIVWAAAGTLRYGDYLALPTAPPPQRPDTQDLSALRARILGYYLGDGSIQVMRTRSTRERYDQGLRFSVGAHERDHLHRLLTTLTTAGLRCAPHIYPESGGRKALIVTVTDPVFAAQVRRLGGAGSRGKRLAEDCFTWTPEAKMELVAGYIDTDGHFNKAGQVSIGSVNRGLLLDVQRLLLTLGVTASVGFSGTASTGYAVGTRSWSLQLSAAEAQKFLGRSTKVRPREVAWAKPSSFFWGGYWFAPVQSVTANELEVPVYNISVEGDESYIAEGRAVHNCSICLDDKLYAEAIATYDPKKHKDPGAAALEFHKKLLARGGSGIRGLAPTRKTYCQHARTMMNKILPDGRKVWVRNPYPRFFDQSFVFIGADKTSKMMMKIAGDAKKYWFLGSSAKVAEDLGFVDEEEDKVAAYRPVAKSAEIVKNISSNFVGSAVPVMNSKEKDIPTPILNRMGGDLPSALSTSAGMGIVLRPREFQRVVLVSMGDRPLADELDRKNVCFSRCDDSSPAGMSPDLFSMILSQLLLPLMLGRSLLRPMAEPRAVLACCSSTTSKPASSTSLPSKQLDKIASAYNGYRAELIDMMAYIPELLKTAHKEGELSKVASAGPEALFSHLSVGYAKLAFLDEFGAPSDITGLHPGV